MYEVHETDLTLEDGRTLHVYDTGAASGDLPVFWHHGTPNIGTPPVPLFAASAPLGVRWIGYDRPGYGGSSPQPDDVRHVGSAARHVTRIADRLGLERFAVMGHSGGGPHALACGALLPERVLGVVSVSGLAPYGAEGLEWFAGMNPASAASLQAALDGREAKARYEASAAFDPEAFTPADYDALSGTWSWFDSVVEPAQANGPGGLISDDLAYVAPWDFEPAATAVPTLLIHGKADLMVPASHSVWLAQHIPAATLRLYPDDGHISVLNHAASALAWLHDLASFLGEPHAR